MQRSVTIELSRFAFEALAGEEGEGREHVPARLARDIRCYLDEAGSEKPGWRYPDFLRGREPGERMRVEISIEEELWHALEEEAERQAVSTAELVEHVALFYAAEVNAGRLTERILERLEDDPAA